ncbi:MAG: UDP binding domain-containing protein, partial [Desulfomonilia bacterium]
VDVFDPVADPVEVEKEYGISLISDEKDLTCTYEGIVVAVAHEEFRNLNLQRLKADRCVVYDIKNLFPDADAYL